MKQKPAQQSKLNIQLRPASVEEAGLFYSQMEEGEDRSLGTVGHLRMDFGHGARSSGAAGGNTMGITSIPRSFGRNSRWSWTNCAAAVLSGI